MPVGVLVTVITLVVVVPVLLMVRRVLGGLSRQQAETRRLLAEKPWLRWPYYGLVELQLLVVPHLVKAFKGRMGDHPVLAHG